MKIVVLDGNTTNPGDIGWGELHSLGECVMHDHTKNTDIIERAKGAEIVLTNKIVIGKDAFKALPELKFISVLATGYNVVDVDAANEAGVYVSNVPTYGTNSVAQMAFAHILEFTQHVGHHSETVKAGRWALSRDFCYWDFTMTELSGMTIGIVGFGRIGQATAKIALGFGMNVIAYDAFIKQSPMPEVKMVDMETVFKTSDFISLHCNLTAENKGFINKAMLSKMKKTAFLINTSRGPLINEPDLIEALNTEVLAGAGLDVLTVEPPAADNPLYKAKNCQITPHISWATTAARKRLVAITIGNIKAYISGSPINVVNKPKR